MVIKSRHLVAYSKVWKWRRLVEMWQNWHIKTSSYRDYDHLDNDESIECLHLDMIKHIIHVIIQHVHRVNSTYAAYRNCGQRLHGASIFKRPKVKATHDNMKRRWLRCFQDVSTCVKDGVKGLRVGLRANFHLGQLSTKF
jgi:hypothetical protein